VKVEHLKIFAKIDRGATKGKRNAGYLITSRLVETDKAHDVGQSAN
jgi:hypothetical protein